MVIAGGRVDWVYFLKLNYKSVSTDGAEVALSFMGLEK